jgi:hypothetical protein
MALLESRELSEADRQQQLVLADLNALLKLLTSSVNEVERRRAERERLEALKRSIRALIDEQLQILYRTQHVKQRLEPSPAQPGAATGNDVAEMLRQLERLERLTERSARDLHRQMEESEDESPPTPGTPQVEHAAQEMQQAADRLGGQQPGAATQNQEAALEQLQRAFDELDDALRQVRREETEETLAALETRLRNMLTRERRILQTVSALDEKGVADWTRVDRLRLAEAAETQRSVHDECETTLRILVDEGSTVIVPELIRQMATDMAVVARRLERSETSAATQDLLTDIIALLEELLEAVERKREADAQRGDQEPPPGDQPRPLLPSSAELKLLRSAQLRVNERTRALAASRRASDPDHAESLERLSQRQRHLAELTRRMNERK